MQNKGRGERTAISAAGRIPRVIATCFGLLLPMVGAHAQSDPAFERDFFELRRLPYADRANALQGELGKRLKVLPSLLGKEQGSYPDINGPDARAIEQTQTWWIPRTSPGANTFMALQNASSGDLKGLVLEVSEGMCANKIQSHYRVLSFTQAVPPGAIVAANFDLPFDYLSARRCIDIVKTIGSPAPTAAPETDSPSRTVARSGPGLQIQRITWQGGGKSVPALRLVGEIRPGDDIAFKEFLKTSRVDEPVLFLDSPGGHVLTATRLAKIIRDYGFMTGVEEDAECVSACFILYSAGFVRWGQDGTADPTRIGIHRAYISRDAMAQQTPEEARRTVAATSKLLADALQQLDVPQSIVRKALDVPSNRVYYLSAKEVESMRVPPWMEELTYARCRNEEPTGDMGVEAVVRDLQRMQRIVHCQFQVLVDHRLKNRPGR